MIDETGFFDIATLNNLITDTINISVDIKEDEQEFSMNDKPLLLPPKQEIKIEFDKGFKEIPVFLKGNREAKIFMPFDFTDEDLIKVSKVLNAYLP